MLSDNLSNDKQNSNETLDAALAYANAGISFIPIKRNGSKAPDGSRLPREWNKAEARQKATWTPLQKQLPTGEQIQSWFGGSKPAGIATVGGAISGGLEILDFDTRAEEIFARFCELVEAEAPELLAKINVVQTPRKPTGYHLRYRRPGNVPGNTKLAIDPNLPPDERTLIETRGEGGYALAPGSPPDCHENNEPYRHIQGPAITNLVMLTDDEVEILWRCARSFDLDTSVFEQTVPPSGGRVGDDFNERGPDAAALLTDAGWAHAGGHYWRRPGKDIGHSATLGYCKNSKGHDLFCVFTSNSDPFPGPSGGKSYSIHDKFGIYTYLKHKGDFKAAAKDLAKQGYGGQEQATSGGDKPNGQKDHGDSINEEAVLETRTLAGMRPKPIRWTVPGYIPLGKVALFAGDGGHGKSTLTLYLAACRSRGQAAFGMPDADPLTCDTLLIQCEDDWEDTVVPRLLALGADMARIHKLDGVRGSDGKLTPFSLAHYNALERKLEQNPHIKQVIIDPAGAYIGSGVDDHRDSELRSLLGPLAELAARRAVTILLVKHFSKAPTVKAVSKISGSTGYVNSVRAAFVVLPDEEDEDRALFLPVKFNIGRRPKGLAFRRKQLEQVQVDDILRPFDELTAEDRQRIGDAIFALCWEGTVDTTADSLLAEGLRNERGPSVVEKCAAWIKQFLAQYAYPDPELQAAAENQGFTFSQLKRAKAKKLSENSHFPLWGPCIESQRPSLWRRRYQ
jgi:hypothetical protein